MEKRYYIDGKCIFSYDDDMFSDEEISNIKEMIIDPIADKVYEKYYEEQLVQQILENTLKKNDAIFKVYCDIKKFMNNEKVNVEYIQEDDDTLLKRLMREKLNSDEYVAFEELLDEAGIVAFKEEMEFLGNNASMIEHYWMEWGTEKRKCPIR